MGKQDEIDGFSLYESKNVVWMSDTDRPSIGITDGKE